MNSLLSNFMTDENAQKTTQPDFDEALSLALKGKQDEFSQDYENTAVVLEYLYNTPEALQAARLCKVEELESETRLAKHYCDEMQKSQTELAAAKDELKAVREALKIIRDNPRLLKSGGAGGQDKYAGEPPMMRIIDHVLGEGYVRGTHHNKDYWAEAQVAAEKGRE